MHAHQYALHPALPIPLPSTTLKFFLLHSCHKHAFRLDYFTTLLTCSAYSLNAYRTSSKLKVVESELYCGWLLDVVAEQETRHSARGVWAVRLSLRGSFIKSLRVHDLCHAYSLVSLQSSGPSNQ